MHLWWVGFSPYRRKGNFGEGWVIGWMLSRLGSDNRKAMALKTSVGNVGFSLVIATCSFPGTPAVTELLAYAVFQTIVLASLAIGWSRGASASSGRLPAGVTRM